MSCNHLDDCPRPDRKDKMQRMWKFLIETDAGSFYVNSRGKRDEYCIFIGTELEASLEATKRVFAYENMTGETPASVEYVSQGKSNAGLHRTPGASTTKED